MRLPVQQLLRNTAAQEKQDDSWSSIYVRASLDNPRGGIVMKMENNYAIVSPSQRAEKRYDLALRQLYCVGSAVQAALSVPWQ